MAYEIEAAIGLGLLAVAFAVYLINAVLRKEKGTPKMEEIAAAIREGSSAYLSREYRTLAVFVVILAVILAALIGAATAITFVAGAILSALAGYIGMNISVRANVRTAQAAKKGLREALDVAVKGGAVTGFFVVGTALIGVSVFYFIYGNPLMIVGFGLGASLVSLFARIGGGIYTKAADVGADLVGKVEAGIPEDDPRNPAVIADNVGDNVGDCAGMAADLFETYAVTLIAAMLIGVLTMGYSGAVYPIMLSAAAVIASIIGILFIRGRRIMSALYKGLISAAIVSIILFYIVTAMLIGNPNLFYSSVIGIAISLMLFAITEYYTSSRFSSVRGIAEASETGPATNIITGLSVGMFSTGLPVIVIVAGILAAFLLSGVYGVAIAVTAMLSLTGLIITLDSYGPITDNAGGIAEMSNLDSRVRAVTDKMDAVGNTTKAVTKAFAIGSAALASITLFSAYVQEVNIVRKGLGITEDIAFSLGDPLVLAGLFIGALIPFLFSSMLMRSVGRGAHKVVEEVRRQFKSGILTGKAKPDYSRCVDIVTKAALKEMSIPAVLAVASPLAVGFILGAKALGGLLLGSIISGFLLAIMMTTGGAAWDNAKKLIESRPKGKGSEAHRAAVIGDTIGDPYKDTAGPAINPLIKVMNTIAIIFISLIVMHALV